MPESRPTRNLLGRQAIHRLNHPNFEFVQIVVAELEFALDPASRGVVGREVRLRGSCCFPEAGGIRELEWDHVPASLLMVAVSQAGKAAQALCTGRPGVALDRFEGGLTRRVGLDGVAFTAVGRLRERGNRAWSQMAWEFENDAGPFATLRTRAQALAAPASHGVRGGGG